MWRMGRIGRCANGGGGWELAGARDRWNQTRNVHWEAEEFEHADWDHACRPVLYRARTAQTLEFDRGQWQLPAGNAGGGVRR